MLMPQADVSSIWQQQQPRLQQSDAAAKPNYHHHQAVALWSTVIECNQWLRVKERQRGHNRLGQIGECSSSRSTSEPSRMNSKTGDMGCTRTSRVNQTIICPIATTSRHLLNGRLAGSKEKNKNQSLRSLLKIFSE